MEHQQPTLKRQGMSAKPTTWRTGERKPLGDTCPMQQVHIFYHKGPVTQMCQQVQQDYGTLPRLQSTLDKLQKRLSKTEDKNGGMGICTRMGLCSLENQRRGENAPDLMPVRTGISTSLRMGLVKKNSRLVIVCDEKLVQVPYGNETLTFCGNGSSNRRESPVTL
ncbi:hypothetical protein Tco_0840331 [Tanacetum coccineum]|uniref:Uncharacterized protein n=1 Tax=Tanacetum coccineum TaxID=301880 RepID=A0ABQ5AV51_9ASTR